MKDGKKYVVVCAVFFFSLTFCLLTYDTRMGLGAIVVDFFFLVYYIYLETSIKEKKKREEKNKTSFSFINGRIRTSTQAVCQTRTYSYTWQNCLQVFRHFNISFLVFFLLLQLCAWWLMVLRECEFKCTVDFDFSSRLAYVCHHDLSFAYYHDTTTTI
jgi:hypothetical protein